MDDAGERLPFEPETVLIPAGPFVMGADPTADPLASVYEAPAHVVDLPDYRIGKFPVTVGEYRAFMEARGYFDPRWWTEAGWEFRTRKQATGPRFWSFGSSWLADDRFPVIGVSWYEAYAYTRWLSDAAGRDYRLPTESEWEKAARGTDERVYPWGDEWRRGLCNWQGAGVGRTTPVGAYSPAGDSPYGVADLGGNAREWCLTKWRLYYGRDEDNDPEGVALRCMRGGGWDYGQELTRCAFRSGLRPFYASALIGLRVCLTVPAPPA